MDARGATNAFGYDAAGRRISETNAWGTAIAMVTTNGYDADGNQTVTVDNLGRTNRYYFDALNRMTRSHLINGRRWRGERFGPPREARRREHPKRGCDRRATNRAAQRSAVFGHFSPYFPVPNGDLHSLNAAADIYEMTNTTFPDGTTQLTAYDADGRKTSQTDQAGVTTAFGYDGLGRLTSVTNALQKVTTYAYDEAGNQTKQVDALLRTNVYVYDGLGRCTPSGGNSTQTFLLRSNRKTVMFSVNRGLFPACRAVVPSAGRRRTCRVPHAGPKDVGRRTCRVEVRRTLARTCRVEGPSAGLRRSFDILIWLGGEHTASGDLVVKKRHADPVRPAPYLRRTVPP